MTVSDLEVTRKSGSRRGVLFAAVLLDCSGILAMGVVATFALSIVREVGRGDSFAGHLATVFFVAGSLAALTLGRRIDRFGARRSALLAGSATSFVALPMLAVVDGPVLMLVACGVAGCAFAITLPATNAVLRELISPDRTILAVCIKQAAIPLALVLASAAAPLGGHRVAFVAANGLSILAFVSFAWLTARTPGHGRSDEGESDLPRPRVARYAVATMLASLLAGALIGYAALSLSQVGLGSGAVAGILLFGNLGGIATRVLTGWLAERSALRSWWTVSLMMLAGGLGTLGLASDQPGVAVTGCLVAFVLGWGWSGLTFALILVSSGGNPGSSGALLQAGGMVGSAAGPVVMALAVQAGGLGFGWCVMAASIAAAGLLVAPGRRSS